ncbi:MAG: hypothetical protein ACYTFY_12720 [Planctomycetota bacterium]|jgi:hypothetical protein
MKSNANFKDGKLPRVIANDDATTFLFGGDNLNLTDLETYLQRYADTHVDLLSFCVSSAGGLSHYNTDLFDSFGKGFENSAQIKIRRMSRNKNNMLQEGGYFESVYSLLNKIKIPVLGSIRMNDCHMEGSGDNIEGSVCASSFWLSHPELKIGKEFGYYGSALNYSYPEVREQFRSIVNEVIEKFPELAGIELDFMRNPFVFKPGSELKNIPIMNNFIEQIRMDLNKLAEKNNNKYLLSVNLPRSPEVAKNFGFDAAAWSENNRVDIISTGAYLTDMLIPVEEWRKELKDNSALYLYANSGLQTSRYMSYEEYCAFAANAYGMKADGIYLFNYCCFDELCNMMPRPVNNSVYPPSSFPGTGTHPDIDKTRTILSVIGDYESIKHENKHYGFYMEEKKELHFSDGPIVLKRKTGQDISVPFKCYEVWEDISSCILKFKAVSLLKEEEISISLNNKPITASRIQRMYVPNGRDARLHPIALSPYSEYIIELEYNELKNCNNIMNIQLFNAEPELSTDIQIAELEVIIKYD